MHARHGYPEREAGGSVELTPRYELVDGELLVTPAPTLRHQRIVLELAARLRTFLSATEVGEVVVGPVEVHMQSGEYDEPDLFVLPLIDGHRRLSVAGASHPRLVCEVLSPSLIRHDRLTKRRAFQRNAIPEYRIVDGEAEVFEVWQLGDERPAIVDDRLDWAPVGAREAFSLDVRAFFASVADGTASP